MPEGRGGGTRGPRKTPLPLPATSGRGTRRQQAQHPPPPRCSVLCRTPRPSRASEGLLPTPTPPSTAPASARASRRPGPSGRRPNGCPARRSDAPQRLRLPRPRFRTADAAGPRGSLPSPSPPLPQAPTVELEPRHGPPGLQPGGGAGEAAPQRLASGAPPAGGAQEPQQPPPHPRDPPPAAAAAAAALFPPAPRRLGSRRHLT